MSKARVTIVFEYELNPDNYEGENDPAKMLAVDEINWDNGDLDIGELADSIVHSEWEVVDA